jgi:hypothetical protein
MPDEFERRLADLHRRMIEAAREVRGEQDAVVEADGPLAAAGGVGMGRRDRRGLEGGGAAVLAQRGGRQGPRRRNEPE